MQKRRITVVLAAALVIFGIYSLFSIYRLQGNARVINYAGIVRGASQRLVKQEVSGVPNDQLVETLDGILRELKTGEGENNLIRMSDPEFQNLIIQMEGMWAEVKAEITKVRQGEDTAGLFEVSEIYFELTNRAVNAAERYSELCVRYAALGIVVLVVLCLAAAGIVAWYSSIQEKRRAALAMAETENRRREKYLNSMAEELRAPMNEISELLYVADMDNYELLFINEAGKKTFHIGEASGQKCYRVLQGREQPCPFCTNRLLKPGENYNWEFTNPLTGRHYLLRDRLVEWDGRPARLELAFDTTESEREKEALRYTLNSEKMIVECIRTLYQEHDLDKAVTQVLCQLGTYLSADRAYVITLEGDLLYNNYEWCAEGIESQKELLQGQPSSLIERWKPLFAREECVLIEDVGGLKEISPEEYEILQIQGIRSMVAAPLEQGGNFEGCLGVDNPPPDKMKNIAPLLQTLCYFLISAFRRAENESQLSYVSYHDMLTMFYNRNRYMEDIQRLEQRSEPVGVVYLDINGLKDINDKFGHDYGDKALVKSADLIRNIFEGSSYYRIGGDEFIILCSGMSREEFDSRVRKLRISFQRDILVNAAIGTRWADGHEDIKAIISAADARMYEDKKEYYRRHTMSKRYRHHSDELLYLADPRILEEELKNGRFLVYLQPKISSAAREIAGAEALIRYRSRKDMLVSPADFLPLLEELQTVSMVDFYVFTYVCQRIAQWRQQGMRILPVSVNFSRSSLAQPSLIEKLKKVCSEYEVPPHYLEIELTESVCSVEGLDVTALIENLRRQGFLVALDDFGTEYANLSLLSSVEFDVIKIDKSLVDDLAVNPRTRAIIEAVVEICGKLGTKVVAEGVETEEQFSILRAGKVPLIQGFLFSRPIPVQVFEEKYITPQKDGGRR